MKLVLKATFRHIKAHKLQSIATLMITSFTVMLLSFVVIFISSFRILLHDTALVQNGAYHYEFYAEYDNDSNDFIDFMYNDFVKDTYFDKVELIKSKNFTKIQLTVAHPNVFMSKNMKNRYRTCEQNYRLWKKEAEDNSSVIINVGKNHNYNLLVSYGDLDVENGMYSFMIVLFIVLLIIALTAVFALSSVFRVSNIQRERDYALLCCIGAIKKQIKLMVFVEGGIYILAAMPIGYLLGNFLFVVSKEKIGDVLAYINLCQPIQTISPMIDILIIFMLITLIIYASLYKPALEMTQVQPITSLRQTKTLYLSKSDYRDLRTKHYKQIGCAYLWLGNKNYRRFKKRYSSLISIMVITVALSCFVSGFSKTTKDVISGLFPQDGYNIQIDLYCDDVESLNEATTKICSTISENIYVRRMARFNISQPYPEMMNYAVDNSGRMPDVMLISIGTDEFQAIIDECGVVLDSKKNEGILIKTDAEVIPTENNNLQEVFTKHEEIIYPIGKKSKLSVDDVLSIKIVGIIRQAPQYTEDDYPNRMFILLPEETFIDLEPLRPTADYEKGVHHITLFGTFEGTSGVERRVFDVVGEYDDVSASIYDVEAEKGKKNATTIGVQYFVYILIFQFVLICVCSNFVVFWTNSLSRQHEFATLMSLGMLPKDVKKMIFAEQSKLFVKALITGECVGVILCICVYLVYLSQYDIKWSFPYEGIVLGVLIVAVSFFASEIAIQAVSKQKKLAELLRCDEL